ncbi:hypothetical protein STCU_05975 [Strigomonas culicis]|uniref:USP domain-containing protein n=1 Tax=Strigomonas culicis TaxID=28005 RepID=S9UE42_9TRYP|nr:hypothetical protein STCU_05975 [Strigomonas culicis]|eukprot:EPY26994.1 hypothetical protein STCU_05975 [Strigomonas culicis]
MKRFKAGTYFTTKKMDPVAFPMAWEPLPAAAASSFASSPRSAGAPPQAQPYVLDLRHYMDPLVAQDLPTVPVGMEAGKPPIAASRSDGHLVSSYTLEATVHHRGSYGGGHYVTYAKKDDAWVFISDDTMAKVEAEEVRDNTVEPYLFLYAKQPLVQPSEGDARTELQALAQHYLHQAAAGKPRPAAGGGAAQPVYLSRMWLHRMAFFHDPGPIINPLCYCAPAGGGAPALPPLVPRNEVTGSKPWPAATPQPHVHGPPVAWYYVEVAAADYDKFYKAYGGTQAVTRAALEELARSQASVLRVYEDVA